VYAQALLYLGHLGGLRTTTAAENTDRSKPDRRPGSTARIAAALAGWGLERQARLPLRVSAGSAGAPRWRGCNCPTPCWILDEPFNALDVDAVAQLGRLIETHLAGGGLAVVTSHMDLPIAPAQLQSLRLS
jgi:heme exporter protein A